MDAWPIALSQVVERLGEPRVLVVGDLILDRYVWGDAERISQEAPVILLRAERREERLGGAASVSSMLSALGARVRLAGVLGDDDASIRSRELLAQHHVNHDLVFRVPGRPSTLKERYIGLAQQKHPQQMLRVDYETREPIEDSVANRLAEAVDSCVRDSDIVLVSDYDKGLCIPSLLASVIRSARRAGVRVIVDPARGGDYAARYRGCSAMTPNRLEAGLATGAAITDVKSAIWAADRLRTTLEMEVGVVTMDRDGMVLVDQGGRGRHFPVRPRDVYDITGAGDMVLAVIGMVLAAGFDYPEAIAVANAAGGLEVERVGVATLTREEIVRDLLHADGGMRVKAASRQTLAAETRRLRREGRKVVFTNGCFDILHAGHVQYLREARRQGDVLVVGLNSDASVRRLGKGPDRPINPEGHRAAVLSALECVDYVTLFDEETPLELIRAIEIDVLVKGADYRPEEVVGREWVESRGGRLHLAPLAEGMSTTVLIDRIRGRRGGEAAKEAA